MRPPACTGTFSAQGNGCGGSLVNQTLRQQIVAFLNVAGSLKKSIENPAGPSKLSRGKWENVLHWLDEGGLALTYWTRLKETGTEDSLPPEIRVRLEQNLEDHRLRITQMVSEFGLINSSFEAAGVQYAVLKGFALVPEYCPDIFLRTTYDYDYLVPAKSVSSAECALKAAGFIRKESADDHPIVYFHNARRPRSPLSRNDLYSATFPRTIELHYLFWDSRPLKIPLTLPGTPLAHIELRHISSFTSLLGQPVHFYALSREDELLFQLLHTFRHILNHWCRLSSLLDIAYFLDHRALDAVFWNRFLSRLGDSQPLQEIAGIVFLLAKRVFGATIPDSVYAQVIRTLARPLVLWVERYGEDSALSNFSDNKLSLFLHHEFIQDQSTWREIRRTRLFPMRRPSRVVQGAVSSQLPDRWKQGRYTVQRLKHHLIAAARYGLESPRWRRARMRRE